MQPIHQLLDRIRWDPRFGKGRFEIGYYDRIARRVLVVPLGALRFRRMDPDRFCLIDDEGMEHRIPLHRVRRVYRDGRLIWQRPPRNRELGPRA